MKNRTIIRSGEAFHFASVDGENWLEVDHPIPDTPEAAQELDDYLNGRTEGQKTLPMRWATRGLNGLEAS